MCKLELFNYVAVTRKLICLFYYSSAQIISNLGEKIINELTDCWSILVERLKNEITRLTAVKAIQTIAEYVLIVKILVTSIRRSISLIIDQMPKLNWSSSYQKQFHC